MKRKRLVSVVILQFLLVVFMLTMLTALLFLFVSLARFGFDGASVGDAMLRAGMGFGILLYCVIT
jgi:hypothetical protein